MAEKGFGVKEVNLIGASGTPTITSPNNLNLNAVNVAISTNATVGGTLSVTGNVSVGGTLTYEDVTNVDAVGIITAREGIFIPDSKELKIGNTASSPDLKIYHDTNHSYIQDSGTGHLKILVSKVQLLNADGSEEYLHGIDGGGVKLRHDNNVKLETTSSGATVTGTLVATTFSGSGASLTNVPAATPTDSDIQVAYTVTANGSSAYRFAGNGVVSTADNPDLYLIRGQKYRFINNSGGSHPFQIREASGGTAYSTGVTNNGAASGNIDFAPTYDSPAQLVYQCTSHGGMVGNIYLRDAAGNNTNVGVTTFIGHVQANNIKLDRGSAQDVALRISTTSSTGASRISFDESGTSKGQVSYSHDNDQIELSSASGNGLALITNGFLATNAALKINSSGHVTKPKHICFAAKGTTNHTAGSVTHIDYTQQLFDNGGNNYDPTAGQSKFTAPVSGYYFFHATCMFDSNLSGFTYCFLDFKINGTSQGRERMMPRPSGGNFATIENSAIFYLTANQYVQVYITQHQGNPMNVRNDYRFFEGYLIG